MASEKVRELRVLLGVAVQLRNLADASGDPADVELFFSAALALEARANRLAFGGPDAESPGVPNVEKVDLVC